MTAVNQQITLYAGDYKELWVHLAMVDGTPVETQPLTAQYKIAKVKGGVASHCLDSVVPSEPVTYFKFILTPEFTSQLGGVYHHEVEIIDVRARRFTVVTGTLTVHPTLACGPTVLEDDEPPG